MCTQHKPVDISTTLYAHSLSYRVLIRVSLQLKTLSLDIDDIDRKNLSEIRRRFLAINRHRIARIREDSGRTLRRIIDAIPMLIHVNHPTLPGYQTQKTPCAISDFSPSKVQITAARRISKSFSYEKRARMRRDIISVFIMGSMGTLGQSQQSDLDIWVIHRENIKPRPLQQLQKKLTAIEQWANDRYVKLHFFLMAPDYFKTENQRVIDSENCGSSQHFLLLDEFYRTALLLAGRYPLWWLVPPQYEAQYSVFVSHLIHKRFLRNADYIDLGGVASLPMEEYFGAALWHLNKAIDSPYKSTLKMLLMESYAASYPNVEPVCHQFKENVYAGHVNDADIDPYVLIFRHIEKYLGLQQNQLRMEWVRRCLYLKTRERLSVKPRSDINKWRRQLMQKLVAQWGWEKEKLMELDARRKWKIKRTLEERKSIIRELTQSYRFLSHFARDRQLMTQISSADMSTLGRKLHANFERRADKIDKINPGISPDLSEPELSFVYLCESEKPVSWALLKGAVPAKEVNYHRPVHRHRHLMGLLLWVHINGLINAATKVTIVGEHSPVTSAELRALIRMLNDQFQLPAKTNDVQAFEQQSVPVSSLYVINIGEDAMEARRRKGVNLVSERNDPLSYGSSRENLLICVDILSLNSWHEISYRRIKGNGVVLRLLQHAYENIQLNRDCRLKVKCPAGSHAFSIQKRINELMKRLLSLQKKGPPSRFIWQEGRNYQFIGITKDVIEPGMFEKKVDLMQILQVADINEQFTHTEFDKKCLMGDPVHLLSQFSTAEQCHLYFYEENNLLTIWVSDEAGALGQGEQHYDNLDAVIRTYEIFLGSVIERKQVHSTDFKTIDYRFYRLKKKGRKWQRELLQKNKGYAIDRYYPVQALLQQSSADQPQVTLYCGEKLFTELEYGETLFYEIARFINQQRVNGGRYPVYITDLDISNLSIEGAKTSLRFLQYKWQLEKQLNAAMVDLLE